MGGNHSISEKAERAGVNPTTPDLPLNKAQVRLLLADADTAFMNRVEQFLISQPEYQVVARVESCLDALIWCEELRPQILILDWHLMFEGLLPQPMKGTEFVHRVKGLKHPPGVIIASRLSLDDHRSAALSAGADEFMPKTKFPQLLRPLIKRLTPQF